MKFETKEQAITYKMLMNYKNKKQILKGIK